jgi:hypothetical protein
MTLRKWRRIQKGALIGAADIALPFGESWLDVDGVSRTSREAPSCNM